MEWDWRCECRHEGKRIQSARVELIRETKRNKSAASERWADEGVPVAREASRHNKAATYRVPEIFTVEAGHLGWGSFGRRLAWSIIAHMF